VIGDRELLPSERRIVDDRGLLAAPGENVAVDRVPAGVADAVPERGAVVLASSTWNFLSSGFSISNLIESV